MEVKKTFRALKLGDRGPEIRKARKMLAKHGSSIQSGDTFDIGMMSAVKSFQRRHKIIETGIIDQKTWDKLNMIICVKKKAAAKKKIKSGG